MKTLIARLFPGGLLFASLLVETVAILALIALGVVIMELINSFLIEPAIRSYGWASVFWAMAALTVAALGTGYFILARHLWRKFPDRPAGVGKLRWLLTIYGRCWWRGLSSVLGRKVLLVWATGILFLFGVEWLIAKNLEEALIVVGAGLASPIIAVVTCYYPLLGLNQLQEAAKKR